MTLRRRLAPLLAALALLAGAAACSDDDGGDAAATTTTAPAGPAVTVMTRNLYLGADLLPLFEATAENLGTVARATYDQVVASAVEDRMAAVAAEIAATDPDLVALQEATLWKTQAPGASEPTVLYDFLQLLLDDLGAAGEGYTVAATADGFSGGLPIEGVGTVTMQDRDVILLRDGSDVQIESDDTGQFDARMTVSIAGAAIEVLRGWAAVDATVGGQPFRLVATHLEAFDNEVRDTQQQELLADALGGDGPTLLLGDLNSTPSGEGSGAYQAMLDAGFADVWPAVSGDDPGFTYGRTADLLSGEMRERIDFVFFRGALTPRAAEVVGTDEAVSRTAGGQWSSDHAGVVATLSL